MILRSQLRMNKNILFPFVSCILIMLTLLVLIHKSADELNSVKKELGHCKQKHELASSQLQNAIDGKLRLEKSLANEKTKDKQHADEMQSQLKQEQEELRKEKENWKKEKDDADVRFEELKRQLESLKTENQDLKNENGKLGAQVEQLQSDKDKEIERLKNKIQILANFQPPSQKAASESKPAPPAVAERVDLVASVSKGSTTPVINPQAIVVPDESPKQVAPPPNNIHDNMIDQDMMQKSLDMRPGDDGKMNENVIKSPIVKSDEKKNVETAGEAQPADEEKKGAENFLPNDNMLKNQQQMNLPLPYANEMAKKLVSSASNNAAERAAEDPADKVAAPVLNPPADDKEKLPAEIPKQMNNYQEDIEDEDYAQDKNEIVAKDGAKNDV